MLHTMSVWLAAFVCPPDRVCTAICRWVAFALILMCFSLARATPPSLVDLPSEPLGHWLSVMPENGVTLDIDDARQAHALGVFQAARDAVPKFGIGATPVWLHLQVNNQGRLTAERRLLLEISWLNRIDVYHLHGHELLERWQAGDGDAGREHPLPGVGYAFDLLLPPGVNDIYLRVETPDPLLVPLRLLNEHDAEALQRQYDYGYGLFYGFLLALIAYNAMLALGLRERGYFDYVLYLGSFLLLHLAYTGHGYVWLWPQHASFQQLVIPVMMLAFGCTGLRFASGFLELRQHAPRTHRVIHGVMGTGILGMALSMLSGHQQLGVLISFLFLLVFSLAMVWIGALTVQHGRDAGGYFLAAALAAMAGTATTALAVWAGLPYSAPAFHAAGWGVVIEGILFALALAHRMRQYQQARQAAEQLARIDSLTGLLNRRAFFEQAAPLWNTARRNDRPLAVLMADIDHFKLINDTHGHAVGDDVLSAISGLLADACRGSDVAARWGGEEFVMLLPETDHTQARQLAERLRLSIETLEFHSGRKPFRVSASFGIAELTTQNNLEQLINEADDWLYRAKQRGRNRVAGAPQLVTSDTTA